MDLITYDDYDWPPPTGETIHLKRKQFFWANRFNLPSILFGGAVAVFILLVIGFIPAQASAAEPHADSVYFNSATDLIAKTNSVVGVCDTSNVIQGSWGNMTIWLIDDELTITCRELVAVAVIKHPEKMKDVKCIPCPITPGQAVIWWRTIKCPRVIRTYNNSIHFFEDGTEWEMKVER